MRKMTLYTVEIAVPHSQPEQWLQQNLDNTFPDDEPAYITDRVTLPVAWFGFVCRDCGTKFSGDTEGYTPECPDCGGGVKVATSEDR